MVRNVTNAVRNWFRHSQYSKPVLYFTLFFALSSVSIYFFEIGRNQQFMDVMDGLWWAIITFSTTGYGDKVPVTMAGRIVAVLTILIGVGGMSLLSGSLASWLVDRNTKARRGLMDFRKMKEHLIICGWKEDMKEILLSILRASSEYEAEAMIIVSNVEPERVEELKENEYLRGLKFVRGDYFSELSLQRANVSQARKVLILADTLESSAVSEVDSKTVMTVLTCKALAKDVYVTAEVLDKKYESYLKHAQCDEILFSRDFSRQMLASTSVTNGMSHIIYDLLTSDQSGSKLLTEPIPQRFVNGSYGEFRQSFGESGTRLLLGILENTGSPNKMKMEALRDAQKTSDVSQLVSNLQKVKGLEVNSPVFLPEDEHTVQRHSLAIVLERGQNG